MLHRRAVLLPVKFVRGLCTPVRVYERKVAAGEIEACAHQREAVARLTELHTHLSGYKPSPIDAFRTRANRARPHMLERAAMALRRRSTPQGCYMCGGVGVGKTMLMDSFFSAAPVPDAHKRRVHFHDFMLDVHAQMHALRTSAPSTAVRGSGGDRDRGSAAGAGAAGKAGGIAAAAYGGDPLPAVAASIARRSWLLCFDEFQVTDVADALMMRRLFQVMFDHGVVVVATSNRLPGELYEGGLNRASFMPFIDLLQERCTLSLLRGTKDFRGTHTAIAGIGGGGGGGNSEGASTAVAESAAMNHYFCAEGGEGWAGADARLLAALASHQGACGRATAVQGCAVPVAMGRTLHCEQAVLYDDGGGFEHGSGHGAATAPPFGPCAWFRFEDLCGKPTGAADFIALAKAFGAVAVSGVPALSLTNSAEARRFITLVDLLYDHGVALHLSAAVPFERLFRGDDDLSTRSFVREKLAQADAFSSDDVGGATESEQPGQPGERSLAASGGRDAAGHQSQWDASPRVSSTAEMVRDRAAFSASGGAVSMAENGGSSGRHATMLGDVEWSATGRMGVSMGGLSAVVDINFAAARTASRLQQMCTQSWHDKAAAAAAAVAAVREQEGHTGTLDA